ncbi:MAG: hypothetical protein ABIQ04_01360 [Candidatus Saccharimonadales bacterium]
MDWAQILVIILSIFLAIFILLAIILIVMLIRVTQQIKSVTSTAQRAAENIESVVANVSKATSPVFLIGLLTKQFKKFTKSKK